MKRDENFYVGQRVYWNDPGLLDYDPEDRQWLADRIFVIVRFLDEDYDSVLICSVGDSSEAEVWVSELEAADTDTWYDHAHEVLAARFPDTAETTRGDFVLDHWNNLDEDDANVSTFVDWLATPTK